MFPIRLTALLLLGPALGASPALAQSAAPHWSPVEVQVIAGGRNAVVEGTCSSGGGQSMVGGSFRVHTEGGFGAGIEIAQLRLCERQTFTYYHPKSSVTLHMFHDLGRSARVRPYLIGGGGYVRHHSPAAPGKTGLEISGGAGLNIRLPARIVLTPEFQVAGPVLATRFTVGVGFVLW